MSKNFYDNYQFLESLDFAIPTSILGELVNIAVKGQNTGTFVRNLDPLKKANVVGDYTVILYDAKYRPIANYTFFDNKDFTKTEMLLDWQGRVLETHTTHKENENASLITTKEVFTYNEQNQLITHTHQINNGVIETLANNTYNAIGQVQQKNVGGNGTALQAVTYNYNIRGWLTDINNINQPNNKLFNFKLEYNNPSETARNNGAVPLYNGNISATYWQNELDNKVRSYAYKYDEISRLTNAKYVPAYQGETENFDEDITYDPSGNILTIKRKGLIDPLNANAFDLIDDLTYNYLSVNNRLRGVVDKSNNDEGYKTTTATNNVTFSYDQFGNLLSDLSKGITNIEYNYLNLPTLVLFSNSAKIEYIYNANGTKITKKVYQDTTQPPVVTTYRNGFQYIDGVLKFFPHAEGYVNVAENQNFEYIYNYTDHLGNVRVSYKYDQTATETNNIAIVDANNYYPFGLKHKGYGSPNQTPNYKYKFLGQEHQDELGLNWDTFRYRNYDAAIGRFMGVDPITEEYMSISPYQFAHNNPIWKIELEGLEGVTTRGQDVINREPPRYMSTNIIINTMKIQASKPRHSRPGVPMLRMGFEVEASRSSSTGGEFAQANGTATAYKANIGLAIATDGDRIEYGLTIGQVDGGVSVGGQNVINGQFTTFSAEGNYNMRNGDQQLNTKAFTGDVNFDNGENGENDLMADVKALGAYMQVNFTEAGNNLKDLGNLIMSYFQGFAEDYFNQNNTSEVSLNPL